MNEPSPEEVEALAKDVGSLITSLDPTPPLEVQAVALGACFLTSCKLRDVHPTQLLKFIGERYEGEPMTHEEFRARLKAEQN